VEVIQGPTPDGNRERYVGEKSEGMGVAVTRKGEKTMVWV